MLRQATPRKCCPTRPKCCPTRRGCYSVWRGFRVLFVQRIGPTAVKMIIEQIAGEGPCPVCEVLSSVVKNRPLIRVKDLVAGAQTIQPWERKRRLRCGERLCPFTTACGLTKLPACVNAGFGNRNQSVRVLLDGNGSVSFARGSVHRWIDYARDG
jgi:hypothetical protein